MNSLMLLNHELIYSVVDESQIDAEVERRLQAAERDCLEARAAFLLRSSIVDSVIINDPVLNAVHSGDNATPPERSSTITSLRITPWSCLLIMLQASASSH